MGQRAHRDISKVHARARAVMCPGFVVPNDPVLYVSAGLPATRLLAVALASLRDVFVGRTEVRCHTAEAPRAAADVQGAFLPGGVRVATTFGVGVTIGPANVVGGLAVGAASLDTIVAVASFLGAAGTWRGR